jgi:hypothetical protein
MKGSADVGIHRVVSIGVADIDHLLLEVIDARVAAVRTRFPRMEFWS